MASREQILGKLRKAQQPFTDVPPIEDRRQMSVVEDDSPAALKQTFIEEAKKLNVLVHEATTDADAVEIVLDLLGSDQVVMHWDFAYIPVSGLGPILAHSTIKSADMRDGTVRVGITGVDGALASTGSIVVNSGPGKPRTASLLPLVHIAVVKVEQIVPNLDVWFAGQNKDDFQKTSNVVVISGASRTADIGMELVLGAHGPKDLHVVLVE
jgi:L-lactate dehydrogenase complex protein LldG